MTEVSVRNCCWVIVSSNVAEARGASLRRVYGSMRMTIVSLHARWRFRVVRILVASR